MSVISGLNRSAIALTVLTPGFLAAPATVQQAILYLCGEVWVVCDLRSWRVSVRRVHTLHSCVCCKRAFAFLFFCPGRRLLSKKKGISHFSSRRPLSWRFSLPTSDYSPAYCMYFLRHRSSISMTGGCAKTKLPDPHRSSIGLCVCCMISGTWIFRVPLYMLQ